MLQAQQETVGAGETLAPEAAATLKAQTDALAAGTNRAVYFPKGTQTVPTPPENATVTVIPGSRPGSGTWFHSEDVTPQQIRAAVKNGTYGQLLGHIQTKEEATGPGATPLAVVVRDQAGNEVRTSVVDGSRPDIVRAQAEALARQFPNARITSETPESVISSRRKMLPAASPEAIEAAQQDEERYNAALERARTYGQSQPQASIAAAKPQDITADSRRVANLAIGRIRNPIENQYARDVWQSMIGKGDTPVPPYGVTRARVDQLRNQLAEISRGNIAGRVPDPTTVYSKDVLDDARAMMDFTHNFLSQQERPGRYFADMGDETSLTGRGPKIPVTAITSLRGQFPWFADLKESPSDLERALKSGSGANYDRLITAAADHIVQSREENSRMASSIEPNLHDLAKQVRDLDPALAAFLNDAAEGKITTWTETKQEQLAKIEGKISNARQAIEFGRAVDDLSEEDRASRPSEVNAGEEETAAPRGSESTGIGPAEAPQRITPSPESDELEGVLPGMSSAVREQANAAGIAQGQHLTREISRPPESIGGAAGTMERESPLFRGTEASPQMEMLPPRRNEGGFVTPSLARELLTGRLSKDAYQKYVAKPIIEKGLGLGDKYAKVEEADPSIAAGLHLLDNAPAYFRAKAAQTVHNIVDGLSRSQERLFTLMADADSRENLETRHPQEYRQATNDPAIQEALRAYRPIERELTAARQKLQGQTLDQDYLRRVYEQHVAGIGKEQAPGSTRERGTTTYDRIVRPQKIGDLGREATAEYHYQNGLHEFGPAFGTKYIGTNLAALRDSIARDFISKATEINPGDAQPRAISYSGAKYYRPDIAREMREAGKKNVKTYDMYDPSAGVKYPQKGQGMFLGPSDVVRALNDYGAERDTQPGPVRRFLQEQVLGFGFGIPHVANILRRVTQSAPLGAANPEAWARAWKVAFGKELRDRGMNGLDDPTFDRLMR
ncbi:MAG: hypothetical protein ACRD4P_11990, partial [Bryobacteraceae bacterium]